jgi:Smg protein
MKENIFEVLIYLFENYLEEVDDALTNSNKIRDELLSAGFEQKEVDKAFDWLESLCEENTVHRPTTSSFRIFSAQESARLDTECRNFIIFLEQSGILSSTNRELVIDRLIALDNEDISLKKLQWVVLMVLLSQPDEEVAFTQMENIVYEDSSPYLH